MSDFRVVGSLLSMATSFSGSSDVSAFAAMFGDSGSCLPLGWARTDDSAFSFVIPSELFASSSAAGKYC